MKTLFQKILDGEIPSKIVYKDDVCAAINDINPQAPVHVLLFPVKPIARISEASAEDAQILSHLMLTAPKIAEQCGLKDGFRIVINNFTGLHADCPKPSGKILTPHTGHARLY